MSGFVARAGNNRSVCCVPRLCKHNSALNEYGFLDVQQMLVFCIAGEREFFQKFDRKIYAVS